MKKEHNNQNNEQFEAEAQKLEKQKAEAIAEAEAQKLEKQKAEAIAKAEAQKLEKQKAEAIAKAEDKSESSVEAVFRMYPNATAVYEAGRYCFLQRRDAVNYCRSENIDPETIKEHKK